MNAAVKRAIAASLDRLNADREGRDLATFAEALAFEAVCVLDVITTGDVLAVGDYRAGFSRVYQRQLEDTH